MLIESKYISWIYIFNLILSAFATYPMANRLRLGYKMRNNPHKPFDIIINWEDCTWRTNNEILSNLINNHKCLNAQCKDISKKHVQSLFEQVFGYSLAVNPLTLAKIASFRQKNERAEKLIMGIMMAVLGASILLFFV